MDDRKVAADIDKLDNKKRLHLSMLHGVKRTCKIIEESSNNKITFERDAVGLIGEIVWRKLQEMGSDLEHFAKHSKRTTIKPPDVLLLTRRNISLTEHLSNLVRIQERLKRKPDTNAAQPEAVHSAAIESNTESNDACGNVKEKSEAKNIDMIDLSDGE